VLKKDSSGIYTYVITPYIAGQQAYNKTTDVMIDTTNNIRVMTV
jgi:hypothetical protein